MADKLSRSQRQDLAAIEKAEIESEDARHKGGFVRTIYTYHNNLMVKHGWLERADLEYQPPPRVQAHYRLTAKGRAALHANEPSDDQR